MRRRRATSLPPPQPEWAYFFDIDGTLVDIAEAPGGGGPDGHVQQLIVDLYQATGGAVALISGRSLAQIDELVPDFRLPAAGQHGVERRDAAGRVHHHAVSSPALEAVRRGLAAAVDRRPGLVIEDKGLSLALHYRRAPRLAGYAHRLVRSLVAGSGGAYGVQAGKRVVEIKPAGKDKGVAVLEFMQEEPFRGRTPVFVGDDSTDEHAFVTVNGLRGHSVKVARAAARRARRARLARAARGEARSMSSLDLALVGNGTIGALVSPLSEVVWGCFPHFDGDPAFCSLLRQRTHESDFGFFVVELSDVARAEQEYLVNTPMLVTRLYDRAGAAVEITDFAPRFHQYGRMFCPMMLVRQIKRIAGNPRIRVRLRPARDYGRAPAETTGGSNHIRYAGTDTALLIPACSVSRRVRPSVVTGSAKVIDGVIRISEDDLLRPSADGRPITFPNIAASPADRMKELFEKAHRIRRAGRTGDSEDDRRFGFHFSSRSVRTKPKNTMLITPFIVKNAASSLLKSSSFTRECS